MKFDTRKAELPLELVVKEVTKKFSCGRFCRKAEWSPMRAEKWNEVRHEESRAPPQARRQGSVKEVLTQKISQKSGMKFGASEVKLSLEPVIEEAPTKEYEVFLRKLPRKSETRFGASKAKLPSELIIGVKFGGSKAKLPLKPHHRNEVRRK
ncbi:hypothetical protein COCNU_11G011900 [Cocos nucifera]|uniref:Uncharacterized protein n=1 Tax=Cocos nucifera TaxID=13894 RepID=A0A8K0IQN4_COCNU|nr:hypothetical protein COCNU_11G011900 [Cocos nucifera]